MDRKRIAMTLFASALTLAAGSGFAFNNGGTTTRQDPYRYSQTSKQQDKALRDAIKAKRQEYKQLRKAGDPRAEYAKRDLDALNAQWKATHGKGKGRSRNGSVYSNGNQTRQHDRGDDDDDYGERQDSHGRGHAKGHGDDRDD